MHGEERAAEGVDEQKYSELRGYRPQHAAETEQVERFLQERHSQDDTGSCETGDILTNALIRVIQHRPRRCVVRYRVIIVWNGKGGTRQPIERIEVKVLA